MTTGYGTWFALVIMLLLSSCTQRHRQPGPSANLSKESLEHQKISEARALHDRGEIDAAISVLQTWVDVSAYQTEHDGAYELIVKWLLEINRREEAKRIASFFLAHHQKSPSASSIIELFEQPHGAPEPASPDEKAVEPETIEEKSGGDNPMDSVLEKQHSALQSAPMNEMHDKDYVMYRAPIAQISAMADTDGQNGLLHARLATHYFHLGDLERSAHHLSLAKGLPVDIAHSVDLLANEVATLRSADMKSIGVLLPLTGLFAPFGKKALMAMGLAWNIPMEAKEGITSVTKDGVRIVIADSKGDAKETEKVLEQLVKVHKVALVVGDITNDPSLLAAQKCQQYGVPMLSLSRHPSIAQVGQHIFVVNASPQQQVQRLVEHAMKVAGHKRFAILYPRHNYGMSMSRMFFDEVVKHGGSITGIEAYDAHETTLGNPVKKLVGKYYLALRPEAQACTGPQADKCRNSIKPIVDFDALFIPEFQKLALVIPALLQEDLLITKNPRAKAALAAATKNENPPYIQLLGTNSWNEKAVLDKIAQHIEGAYFVDSLSMDENEKLTKFVAAFTSLSGHPPTSLEVFAHDAALLAIHVVAKPELAQSRNDIQQRIARLNGQIGLLPQMSFLKTGELDAPEAGFQITNGVAERQTSL